MNTAITSKEAILKASQKLACETGVQSINIRSVAARCGVSVGSVYNYFPSKADLIAQTVKTVWEDIFHKASQTRPRTSFIDCVTWLFDTIQNGSAEYPSFFTLHSIRFAVEDKEKGRVVMNHYFLHIKNSLLQTLLSDKSVKKNVFTDLFTQAAFVDFVFSNIISLSMQNAKNCDTLTEIIRRLIF